MAKTTTSKRQKKVDLKNLSQRDHDILTLDTKEVMTKYKLEKQPVYDRRFALKKKIESAGLTVEQVLSNTNEPLQEEIKTRQKKASSKKLPQEKRAIPVEQDVTDKREVMVVDNQVPVILKPIEITFDNFSLRLNGVPRKIAVNPETNAVEIDL
jgi:hypothetical protein